MGFDSEISVMAGERQANAKSMTAVLALGATGGTTLALRAEGGDAAAALEALTACVVALQ
jgi:phosphotransferase system HPr (HPr) family protein